MPVSNQMFESAVNFRLFKLIQISLGGRFAAVPQGLTDDSRGNSGSF